MENDEEMMGKSSENVQKMGFCLDTFWNPGRYGQNHRIKWESIWEKTRLKSMFITGNISEEFF